MTDAEKIAAMLAMLKRLRKMVGLFMSAEIADLINQVDSKSTLEEASPD